MINDHLLLGVRSCLASAVRLSGRLDLSAVRLSGAVLCLVVCLVVCPDDGQLERRRCPDRGPDSVFSFTDKTLSAVRPSVRNCPELSAVRLSGRLSGTVRKRLSGCL